ncbi:uncharacterized protein [Nicotiana tomentosiformis]|uniref:uncharacterized protein n=1 Tax=Nicotiana tomentosiformis TaxID=4098 RepID=UPI00388CA1CE
MEPKKRARTGQGANAASGVAVDPLFGDVGEYSRGRDNSSTATLPNSTTPDQATPVPAPTEGTAVPPTNIPIPPPTPASDSGANLEDDPLDFIDEMHKTLRVMRATETEGVELAAYRLKGVAYSWFEPWEDSLEEGSPPARWSEFADAFMDHFLPDKTRATRAAEFENLKQESFPHEGYNAVWKEMEIESKGIRFNMAQELETYTPYQYLVEIAQRLEDMRGREREDREAKRPRGTGEFSAGHAIATTLHGRGYVNLPVNSALPASCGAPATPRSQVAHFAQPLSCAPPAWGAFSGHSSRPGQGQFQLPQPPKAFFECGDTQLFVRDFPRLRKGATPHGTQARRIPSGLQTSQAVVAAPIAAPNAQPARGRGQAGRGRPRGGSHARFYAFMGRTEEDASNTIITCIVPICHRDASILFDPGSTYSYVSSYFSPYLGISVHAYGRYYYYGPFVAVRMEGYIGYIPSKVVSFLKAQQMAEKGCQSYLAFARDATVDTPTVESVPMLRYFPDVFPGNLSGMLSDRDIDLGIDLLPGIIS